MCGIVGFLDSIKDKKTLIKKMNAKLSHRGPDGEGYYCDDFIALAHRRLAIIDLEKGEQPIYNENKTKVIIFNGEIYNYQELRTELQSLNHIFTTSSDTEVIIHGYEEYGVNILNKLRGMFAFAIWDQETKTLFCARDPFGIKPLYYYTNSDTFMFASEIKAFLVHPKFSKKLNKKLLGPYLTFNFTPTTETFFEGVNNLEAGHYLILQNGKLEINQYYELSFSNARQNLHEATKAISEVVKTSLNYHLKSDVNIGAFLSSGIDSSYLTSLAKPAKTFTVGYQNEDYSEIKNATELCAKLNITNINKTISKEEFLKIVPTVMYYMDEPFSDIAAIALYFLAKMASEEVKVVLSGEGADEFFGGYNTYQEILTFPSYSHIPFIIRSFIAKLLKIFPEFKGRNYLVRHGLKLEDRYVGINPIFSLKECQKILSFKNTFSNSTITKPIIEKFKEQDELTIMQAIDIKKWLVKDILHKADRMSMASSLELRVPFVDTKVFAVASSLAKDLKVNKTTTKVALRSAASKVIPTNAFKKKKLGFPVPLQEWIKTPLYYQEIEQTFKKDYVKEFFNSKKILLLLKKARQGKKGYSKKVWTIYSFLKWYEVFFLDIPLN